MNIDFPELKDQLDKPAGQFTIYCNELTAQKRQELQEHNESIEVMKKNSQYAKFVEEMLANKLLMEAKIVKFNQLTLKALELIKKNENHIQPHLVDSGSPI